MRISRASARIATGGILATLVGGLCVAFGLGFSPRSGALLPSALAFDGTAAPNTALLTPKDGSLPGLAPESSEKAKEFSALQYAADQGQVNAQWKIGRMLADGDGVAQNDLRAFEYFSQIANSHAGEPPGTAQAHIVANAFVALGALLPEGYSQFDDRARRQPRTSNVPLPPLRILATPTRNTNSASSISMALRVTCMKQRAGCCWRPIKVIAAPKWRLATSCSAGNRCRGNQRAA